MPRTTRPCPTPGCRGATTTGRHCPQCEARTSAGHRITLICGPPCAGKNTWVGEHAQHGDLVVDLDALYTALNPKPHTDDHDQPSSLRPFAFDARDAVIERLFSGDHSVRAAWIISSAPKREQRAAWKARGVRVVMISATRRTCQERARRHRPDAWTGHIAEWFAAFEDGAIDQTVRTDPAFPPIRAGSGRDPVATPTGEPHGAYHRGQGGRNPSDQGFCRARG